MSATFGNIAGTVMGFFVIADSLFFNPSDLGVIGGMLMAIYLQGIREW
jgi:hypothetical protein